VLNFCFPYNISRTDEDASLSKHALYRYKLTYNKVIIAFKSLTISIIPYLSLDGTLLYVYEYLALYKKIINFKL
jgi:hypothetical protein